MTRIKKHTNLKHFLLVTFFSVCTFSLFAQEDSAVTKFDQLLNMPDKILAGIGKKYSDLKGNIEQQSLKMLRRMQEKEAKLRKKVEAVDSLKEKQLFTNDVANSYNKLKDKFESTKAITDKFPLKEYIPGMDSLQTSLTFLLKNSTLIPADKVAQIEKLSGTIKELQSKLQAANDLQQFVKERASALKEELLNSGVAKDLLGINKEAYYYQQKIASCKAILTDKQKMQGELLNLVRNLPAFKDFIQKHSYLAFLFPMLANAGTTEALAGLQTRESLQKIIGQRLGAAGTGVSPQQYVQQQMSSAQQQLNTLKDKLNKLSGGSSDMTMPNFKPNEQKTKSFWQRLELGMNIQSEKSKYFFPATTDIALTAGYKFTSSATAGLGVSYKIGWGSGWNHIRFTSEGVGLRSYIDIKARGNIWISGGFEYNYLQRINTVAALKDLSAWQRSALIGLTKKYKIGKKKDGNLQILYDFLHNQQLPPAPALKFRVGWGF